MDDNDEWTDSGLLLGGSEPRDVEPWYEHSNDSITATQNAIETSRIGKRWSKNSPLGHLISRSKGFQKSRERCTQPLPRSTPDRFFRPAHPPRHCYKTSSNSIFSGHVLMGFLQVDVQHCVCVVGENTTQPTSFPSISPRDPRK